MRPLAAILFCFALLGVSDAHGQQFEPVSLDVNNEVELTVPDGLGLKTISGPLPLVAPWSGNGATGTASALLVSGEIELAWTVNVNSSGGLFFGFELFDLGIRGRELRCRESRVLVFPPSTVWRCRSSRSEALERFGTDA